MSEHTGLSVTKPKRRHRRKTQPLAVGAQAVVRSGGGDGDSSSWTSEHYTGPPWERWYEFEYKGGTKYATYPRVGEYYEIRERDGD
jgi:hypothetical protein